MSTTGCSQTNITDLIKAVGNDPATVCASGTYAGASIKVFRTALTNGKVSCNDNGLTVESTQPPAPK